MSGTATRPRGLGRPVWKPPPSPKWLLSSPRMTWRTSHKHPSLPLAPVAPRRPAAPLPGRRGPFPPPTALRPASRARLIRELPLAPAHRLPWWHRSSCRWRSCRWTRRRRRRGHPAGGCAGSSRLRRAYTRLVPVVVPRVGALSTCSAETAFASTTAGDGRRGNPTGSRGRQRPGRGRRSARRSRRPGFKECEVRTMTSRHRRRRCQAAQTRGQLRRSRPRASPCC